MDKIVIFAIVVTIVIGVIGVVVYNNYNSEPNIEKAFKLIKSGKYDKAEKVLKDPNEMEGDFHLGEMYYNMSKSDSDPILYKSINHYKEAIKNGYIDAMFPLANIYNYCSLPNEQGVPQQPNKELAKALYTELIYSDYTTQLTKNRANEKLMEINMEMQMTTRPTNRIKPPVHPAEILVRNNIPRVQNVQAVRVVEHMEPGIIRNDSQNVHDSGLQKTFATGYNNLKKYNSFNKVRIPQREIDEHIKNYIKTANGIKPETKKIALEALEHIKKTNQSITNLQGSTEMEVLTNVYNRIYSEGNKANRENLKEMLVLQLADTMPANDKGKRLPVCAQGRVARMFSVFEGIDDNANEMALKPKWVIKDEIGTLAAKTRDDYLKGLTKKQRDYYNMDGGDTPEGQNEAIRITSEIKREIEKNARETYIEKNILKDTELEKELKPILDGI